MFTWDKIFYIFKKKGNNPKYYFYSIKLEKCLIHNSYICDCIKTKSEYDNILKYIELYKYCSKIIIYNNGNIVYIKKENKNQLKFAI